MFYTINSSASPENQRCWNVCATFPGSVKQINRVCWTFLHVFFGFKHSGIITLLSRMKIIRYFVFDHLFLLLSTTNNCTNTKLWWRTHVPLVFVRCVFVFVWLWTQSANDMVLTCQQNYIKLNSINLLFRWDFSVHIISFN